MLGLFGTLELGNRSLQTQRQGVEITGQNLANVNNPAYARQRLTVQTSLAIPGQAGPQGTGVQAVSIQQLRDSLTERQLRSELSVEGYLKSEQQALENAQAHLGETLSAGTTSSSDAAGTASTGLMTRLTSLFNSFQSLATTPESLTERQGVIAAAQELATRLRSTDSKLSGLTKSLNETVTATVKDVNALLANVAELNRDISQAELGGSIRANDLRDLRNQKLETLSGLVNLDTAENPDGSLNLVIDGTLVVDGRNLSDSLESYDAGGGRMLVRAAGSGAALAVTSGKIAGTIAVRDGAIATLRSDVDALASSLITQANTAHAAGFNLLGGTGANFFTGSGAADIGVNTALVADPRLIQASGTAGNTGDNQVALTLASLSDQAQAPLDQKTFYEHYSGTVTNLGEALAATNSRLEDQGVIQDMLRRQAVAVSGVSIDEEMTELMKFQKAFEASARLVTTISEMLDEVVNLKR